MKSHLVKRGFAKARTGASALRRPWLASWMVIAALLAAGVNAAAQTRMRGVTIVSDHGYPELHVDGAPFFLHAAAFDYARIPRDLWGSTLDRYRALGINTVDLRIPWNWHETGPGAFDFDGHTNPRRDLRGLLRLVAAKNLHMIARVGPAIGNFWRNAGLPEWVPSTERAQAENDWLTAAAPELAPYQTGQTPRAAPLAGIAGPTTRAPSPPLLFVVLEDHASPEGDLGRAGTVEAGGMQKRRAGWRAALLAGGLHSSLALTPLEAAKNSWTATESSSRTTVDARPVRASADWADVSSTGFGGQWFFRPPTTPAKVRLEGARLAAPDVTALDLLAGLLGTQPHWPAMVIALAASGHAPADDSRAVASDPDNLLLVTRLLLGQGVRGIEYAPLQDTLTPVGWSAPTANRYLRWDAALGAGGEQQGQFQSVRRNAWLLDTWGAQLASSHLRADFGLIVPRAPAGEPRGALRTAAQIQRIAEIAGLVSELVNPERQPIERLLDDPVLLLPVAGLRNQTPLSATAQAALVAYVRRGGTLICFPRRPAGNLLAPLWKAAGTEWTGRDGLKATRRMVGRGSVVVWSKDFYSWADPSQSFQQNRAQFEASWAALSLKQLVSISGKPRMIDREETGKARAPALILSELTPNDIGSVATGRTAACAGRQLCAAALVSATNLDWDNSAQERVVIRSPILSSDSSGSNRKTLDLTVPPHESLLLPVHASLCEATLATTRCPDEVVIAGAELLGAEHDGKTLALTFYTPARATVVLRLRGRPGKIEAGNYKLERSWAKKTHLLTVTLPRGASPDFLRVLKVHLPYEPEVRETVEASKADRDDYTFTVASAVKLPLGKDVSLGSWPPLIVLDHEHEGSLLVETENHDLRRHTFKAGVIGAVRGDGSAIISGKESGFVLVKLHPDSKQPSSRAPGGEVFRGELQVEANHARKTAPLAFATVSSANNAPPAHYRYDFDRDGSDEWVLENRRLRLVLSPAEGGQALALVDVTSNLNLFTTVGAFRDSVGPPTAVPDAARPANTGLNHGYSAEWTERNGEPAIRMRYHDTGAALGGGTIEKTAWLSGENTVEVGYRFTPDAAARDGLMAAGGSLTITSSVPAEAEDRRSTEFCWASPTSPPADAAGQAEKRGPAPALHCALFTPGGAPIVLPAAIRRMEVHTTGMRGLALTWSKGALTIVPKNYSAELRLLLPAAPGGTPATSTLRYTMLPGE